MFSRSFYGGGDTWFESGFLQRRGWVPDDCLEKLGALWLFARLLRCSLRSYTALRLNGLYARAVPSNAIERMGLIGPKHSHRNMVGLIRNSGWCVIAVGSRQQNRLAYRFGFSVEFRTRLTKDCDILNVRAMAIGLTPARNDARMRFAFPSGISSIALVVLSETGTDWSFAEVPATGGVAPFFFASP